jgi:magnesium chelatase family protein
VNPCPCGYYGDSVRACTCAPAQVARYGKRISGPLLDRIDLHVEVPRVESAEAEGRRCPTATCARRYGNLVNGRMLRP